MILAGDVGGTKTALGLFEPGPPMRVVRMERYHSGGYPCLEAILDAFLPPGSGVVSAAAFGVAGPIRKGVVDPTNLAWSVDGTSLARRLGLAEVALLNDLEATAWSLDLLGPEDCAILHEGTPEPGGSQAILAAGTGLGVAEVVKVRGRTVPIASEGGHADFAPRTELELELLRYLLRKFKRVSWERVLSGPGIVNLYEFLRDSGRWEEEPWVREALSGDQAAAAITSAAEARRSELCAQTLELFATLYGAEAGNLALRVLATGGIFLAGGIAPKLLPWLRGPKFTDAFVTKGRLSPFIAAIPVRVILDEHAPLRGVARRACEGA
jgi:glucokinase